MAGIRGDGFISGAGWEAALLTAVLYEVPSSVRHLEIRSSHDSMQSSKWPLANSGPAFLHTETGLGEGQTIWDLFRGYSKADPGIASGSTKLSGLHL